MARLINHRASLVVGPACPGFTSQAWSPGSNEIDPKYWRLAKKHGCVMRWLKAGLIEVDLGKKHVAPKPPKAAPAPEPSSGAADFSGLKDAELSEALADEGLPDDLRKALEEEQAKR